MIFVKLRETAAKVTTKDLKLVTWDREKFIFDNEYSETASQVKKLLLDNPDRYDKYIMPLSSAFHNNPILTIGLHFRLIEIVDLDTEAEEMSLTFTLQLFWYDNSLVWFVPASALANQNDNTEDSNNYTDDIPVKNNQGTGCDNECLRKFVKIEEDIKELESNPNVRNGNSQNTGAIPKKILVHLQDAKSFIDTKNETYTMDYLLNYLYNREDYKAAAELRPDNFYDKYINYMKHLQVTGQGNLQHEYRKLMGATFINVPSEKIWTPEILTYNSNKAKHFQFKTQKADQTDVTIYNDGLVVWEPIIHHTVSCDMELANFSFDVQIIVQT